VSAQTRGRTALPSTDRILRDVPGSRRFAVMAATMLVATAVVHLIDGPGSLDGSFYVGALELALAAACVPLALVLVAEPARAVWIAVASLLSVALGAYLASRTIGLPAATDDIGNWGQTLGIVNVAVESAVIVLAGWVLARHR
jgi:hypothetical protein